MHHSCCNACGYQDINSFECVGIVVNSTVCCLMPQSQAAAARAEQSCRPTNANIMVLEWLPPATKAAEGTYAIRFCARAPSVHPQFVVLLLARSSLCGQVWRHFIMLKGPCLPARFTLHCCLVNMLAFAVILNVWPSTDKRDTYAGLQCPILLTNVLMVWTFGLPCDPGSRLHKTIV
jgi:hypothetical protein